MYKFTRSAVFFGLGLAVQTVSATADITAEDVWASWQTITEGGTAMLMASAQDRSSDQLTLSNVTFLLTISEGTISGTIPQILLREDGGAVGISMSPDYTIEFNAVTPERQAGNFTLLISQPDHVVTASGEPDAISYDYTFPFLSARLDAMLVDEEQVPLALSFEMENSAGSYLITEGDTREVRTEATTERLSYQISGTDMDDADSLFELNGTMQDIASSNFGTLAAFGATGDLGAMLNAGLTSEGRLTNGNFTFAFDMSGPEGLFGVDGSGASGEFDFRMDQSGLSYTSVNEDLDLMVDSDQFQFGAIGFRVGQATSRLQMPLVPSENLQDFALAMSLNGIELDDSTWGRFDPARFLSRDPASIVIDVSGNGLWDPNFSQSNDGQQDPGQLENIRINELVIEALGARASGTGQVDLNLDGDIPTPEGNASLRLEGVNMLLSALVDSGLLPESTAIGAQLMITLFTQPGAGEDVLTTDFEVRRDGSVLANGQRIR